MTPPVTADEPRKCQGKGSAEGQCGEAVCKVQTLGALQDTLARLFTREAGERRCWLEGGGAVN